jgi:CRP-like cAMP-binding protein
LGTAAISDLQRVPLFASIGDAELAEIAAWFELKDVGSGVRLVGEGTTGSTFFVLVEGSASVSSGGQQIASLGPNEFFGEIALLQQGRRSATVTTTAPSRVLVLFGEDFRRLQASCPAIAAEIEATMAERLG